MFLLPRSAICILYTGSLSLTTFLLILGRHIENLYFVSVMMGIIILFSGLSISITVLSGVNIDSQNDFDSDIVENFLFGSGLHSLLLFVLSSKASNTSFSFVTSQKILFLGDSSAWTFSVKLRIFLKFFLRRKNFLRPDTTAVHVPVSN